MKTSGKDDKQLSGEEEGDNHKKGMKEKDKKKKNKQADDEGLGPEKKPRMKTASEVISRIQWDRQLCQNDFIVGYLDRFVGTIEKPFTAFSWVDIATVDDYNTLAIPRHRIQYFKYKDQIVWDKEKRLDDVFGSTGGGKTILSTVEMFSKENQSVEKKEVSDDIENEMNKDVGKVSLVEAPRHEMKRRELSRPNYFVAIRITDPVIRKCVIRIQDAMCEDNPHLVEARTDPSRLHLTLCTMHLDGPHQMSKAVKVLRSLQQEVSGMLAPVTMLRFQGLGQFHDRILYTPPDRISSLKLMRLSQTLQSALRDAEINLVGNHATFNPHMTLFKMDRSRAYGSPPIAQGSSFEQISGVQPVDAIHLCSMEDEERADGFYYCLASMDIQSEH